MQFRIIVTISLIIGYYFGNRLIVAAPIHSSTNVCRQTLEPSDGEAMNKSTDHKAHAG